MTVEEILTGLQGLKPEELERVSWRISELERDEIRRDLERMESEPWPRPDPGREERLAWLESLSGSEDGLPDDYAHNHDHYRHGTPRR